MGAFAGPNIVEDGLVLALDSANSRGYDSGENRITYSQDLTQWGNTSSVDTSNTQFAPDGTQTADEVYATSTAANQGLINKNSNTGSTFVQNSWHTFSVHWKAGTSSGVMIQLPWNDGASAGVLATFVESGGEVSVPTVGGYGNRESGGATVEKLDNGWYRFSITFRPTGVPTGSYVVWLYPSITSGGARTTNTTSYIWGAQTEVGEYATTYVKTEASNKVRGTTWTDLSLKGNNATLVNGTEYSPDNLGVLTFDGTNDYVSFSYPSINVNGPYTVIQWIRPSSALVAGGSGASKPNGANRKTSLVGPGPVWNPGIWMTSDYLRVHAKTQYRDAAINWTTTTWNMIGMTYDGTNTGIIYGGEFMTIAHTTPYSVSNPTTLYIGAETNGGNTHNWLGDVGVTMFYNKVLTAAEVRQNYNAIRGRFGI